MYYTTRLPPSVWRPVSFRKDTIGGQTPTIFPTTAIREGIERSWDTTAHLRACLDAIQSLCSAPSSLTTMNSVVENGSQLPKTAEAHFWRHLFSSRNLKMGYPPSFSRCPLLANPIYVSRSTCDLSTGETSDTEKPTTLRSCPRTTASRLASPLYLLSTATHTLRSVSRSQVRTKQEWLLTPPRTPHWNSHTIRPSRQHVLSFEGTFHWA